MGEPPMMNLPRIFSDGVLDAMLREIEGRIRITCEMTVSLFARL